MQHAAKIRLAETTAPTCRADDVASNDASLVRRTARNDVGHPQSVIAVQRQADVFRQRPDVEVALFVECLCGHGRFAKNVVHLMAMKAALPSHFPVRAAQPAFVARQLTGRFRLPAQIGRGPIDVPLPPPRIIMMRQDTRECGDQRRFGDAGRIRHVIASAEHTIDVSLRRKKPTPPRHVEVRKPFDGKNAKVDGRGVRQTHRDELSQKRVQFQPAFEHLLVKGRALLAGQTSERDKQRPILLARFRHRLGEIRAPRNDEAWPGPALFPRADRDLFPKQRCCGASRLERQHEGEKKGFHAAQFFSSAGEKSNHAKITFCILQTGAEVGPLRCGGPARVQRAERFQYGRAISTTRCAAECGADSAARCPDLSRVPRSIWFFPIGQCYSAQWLRGMSYPGYANKNQHLPQRGCGESLSER